MSATAAEINYAVHGTWIKEWQRRQRESDILSFPHAHNEPPPSKSHDAAHTDQEHTWSETRGWKVSLEAEINVSYQGVFGTAVSYAGTSGTMPS